jgi:hypothetical protein
LLQLFTDGLVRPVFLDDAGAQYVIDYDGHTRVYGVWLWPQDAHFGDPVVTSIARQP